MEGESNLKKNIAVPACLTISVFLATTLLCAQQQVTPAAGSMTEEQVNDANIQLMRQDIRSQRKKVVAANMPLTDTEAPQFWPVYDRYIAETVKVNDVRFALLEEMRRTTTQRAMNKPTVLSNVGCHLTRTTLSCV